MADGPFRVGPSGDWWQWVTAGALAVTAHAGALNLITGQLPDPVPPPIETQISMDMIEMASSAAVRSETVTATPERATAAASVDADNLTASAAESVTAETADTADTAQSAAADRADQADSSEALSASADQETAAHSQDAQEMQAAESSEATQAADSSEAAQAAQTAENTASTNSAEAAQTAVAAERIIGQDALTNQPVTAPDTATESVPIEAAQAVPEPTTSAAVAAPETAPVELAQAVPEAAAAPDTATPSRVAATPRATAPARVAASPVVTNRATTGSVVTTAPALPSNTAVTPTTAAQSGSVPESGATVGAVAGPVTATQPAITANAIPEPELDAPIVIAQAAPAPSRPAAVTRPAPVTPTAQPVRPVPENTPEEDPAPQRLAAKPVIPEGMVPQRLAPAGSTPEPEPVAEPQAAPEQQSTPEPQQSQDDPAPQRLAAKPVIPEGMVPQRLAPANSNAPSSVAPSSASAAPSTANDATPAPEGEISALDRARYAAILDYLKTYEGGGCFAALPALGEETGQLTLDAFGETSKRLDGFKDGLDESAGIVPGTYLKPVSDAQCATLQFIKQVPRYPAFGVYFDLAEREITSGTILKGEIHNTGGLILHFLLVDDEGTVQSLDSFLKFSRIAAQFEIPMTFQGGPIVTQQLLLAIGSPVRLNTVKDLNGSSAELFFAALEAERAARSLDIDLSMVAFSVR
jgi:hypothetical protein